MPSQQNLTLADGLATPVNRVFSAMTPGADGQWARWRYKKTGFAYADPIILYRARPSEGNGARKVDIQIKVPYSTTDTASQTQVVHSKAEFNCSITLPDQFPDTQRPDFHAFVANAMDSLKAGIMEAESYT